MAPALRRWWANFNGVPFFLRCGIFTYEFICKSPDFKSGIQIKDELTEFFGHESIVETIIDGRATKYAVYARRVTKPGVYAGTPLEPILVKRY